MKRSKNVLITGASSGIGFATCQEFAKRGYRVYGAVRKVEDAERLKSELGENFSPVLFDVTDQKAIDAAKDELTQKIGNEGLACLVNNAGIAIGGAILHQDIDEIDKHFQINVIGLIRVTQAFLPLLGASETRSFLPGKIINISSVSGKFAFPFVSAYVGTKHAVEGFSQGLRRELLKYGIDVIIVGPGSVKTPIWDKGTDMSTYSESEYARVLDGYSKAMKRLAEEGLEVETVAQKIVAIHEAKSPKTRYAIVKGYFQNWILPRLIPDRMMDRLIKKQMRF